MFDSLAHGYQALLQDLHAKCLGHTVTSLGPNSTLQDLVNVWAPSQRSQRSAALRAVRGAVCVDGAGRCKFPLSTPLSFFVADEVNP